MNRQVVHPLPPLSHDNVPHGVACFGDAHEGVHTLDGAIQQSEALMCHDEGKLVREVDKVSKDACIGRGEGREEAGSLSDRQFGIGLHWQQGANLLPITTIFAHYPQLSNYHQSIS